MWGLLGCVSRQILKRRFEQTACLLPQGQAVQECNSLALKMEPPPQKSLRIYLPVNTASRLRRPEHSETRLTEPQNTNIVSPSTTLCRCLIRRRKRKRSIARSELCVCDSSQVTEFIRCSI